MICLKKKIRIIIDISMTVMMPLLMAYSLIGELFHEITGSLIYDRRCTVTVGIATFVKRGFPGYMFGKTVFAFFDYAEPRVYFFIDYIAIMILFMMTGCLMTYVLNMISNKSP